MADTRLVGILLRAISAPSMMVTCGGKSRYVTGSLPRLLRHAEQVAHPILAFHPARWVVHDTVALTAGQAGPYHMPGLLTQPVGLGLLTANTANCFTSAPQPADDPGAGYQVHSRWSVIVRWPWNEPLGTGSAARSQAAAAYAGPPPRGSLIDLVG